MPEGRHAIGRAGELQQESWPRFLNLKKGLPELRDAWGRLMAEVEEGKRRFWELSHAIPGLGRCF